MHQTDEFPYVKKECMQILGLPYKKGLMMYVFLPDERFGLAELEKQLSGSQLISIFGETNITFWEVEVSAIKCLNINLQLDVLKHLGRISKVQNGLFLRLSGTSEMPRNNRPF